VLAPVVKEWYPILVKMLPSEGYQAPTNLSIRFYQNMTGVADTSGTRIRCAANWYRQNLLVAVNTSRLPETTYPALFDTPTAPPWDVVHPVLFDARRPR